MAGLMTMKLEDVKKELLPPGAREVGTQSFNEALMTMLQAEFGERGEQILAYIDDDSLVILAFPLQGNALEWLIPLLQAGEYQKAIPLLEQLTKQGPTRPDVWFNLGVAYSEEGQYDEAIIRLKRATKDDPEYLNAWTALGVAYQHLRNYEAAKDALEKALELAPNDVYANQNVGGLYLMLKRPKDAISPFRRALDVTPNEPRALFGLASALEQSGAEAELDEADKLYARLLREFPDESIAEDVRRARTRLAERSLKRSAGMPFRPDAMMYIAGALDLFAKEGEARRMEIAMEIAFLGRKGLDVHSSEQKYTLKSLPGEFTGLHLLSIMYAAFQQIDPSLDLGVDLSQEYAMAKTMMNR